MAQAPAPLLLCLCLCLLPSGVGGVLRRRPHHGTALRRQLSVPAAEQYYEAQTLHHFVNNQQRAAATWSQRYFEDLSEWGGPGAPVFLEMGGEGPAYGAPGGLQRQLAATHRAALVTLEHRFYGASHPLPNMSAASLRSALSAEEALADAAQFIQYWAERRGALGSAWVAFGGSYAGQLAAWLRLRYPTSVLGAVSFSAPVFSQLDFYQYNQLATAAVRGLGGARCVATLNASFAAARDGLAAGGAVRARTAAALHACNTTGLSDADAATLQGSIEGAFQTLVQYNTHGSPAGVAASCELLLRNATSGAAAGSSSTAPAAQLVGALGAVLRSIQRECLVSNETLAMAPLRVTSFDGGTPTTRQWYWQLCNSFGQQTCEPGAVGCAEGVSPMPAPSVFAPFAAPDDLAAGLRMCDDLYGVTATPPAHWSGHQRGWTNVAHGGRELRAGNVIFVNGRKDPYSSVSVLPEQLGAAQAAIGMSSVAVTNGSHCCAMGAAGPGDDPEEAAAKKAVGVAVAAWLAAQNGTAATVDAVAR